MLEGIKAKLKEFFFPAASEVKKNASSSLDEMWSDYAVLYEGNPAAKVGDPDPLVVMGIDQKFDEALKRGEQLSYLMIDDVLRTFAATGSRRGIDICIDAGADPLMGASFPQPHVPESFLDSIELAKNSGRLDLADYMKAYIKTPLYQERMAQRANVDYNTLYLRAMIHAM